MKRRANRLPGLIVTVIFMAVVLAFIGLLTYTRLIPAKFMLAGAVVLAILVVVVAFLVMNFRYKLRFWIGTAVAALTVIIMCVGSVYIYRTVHTLDNITGVNTEVAQIGVYVRTDDAADSINAASAYNFGILSELDRENTDQTINQINTELNTTIRTQEYAGLTELADGLLKNETGAIILNQAYIDVLTQIDGYTDIESKMRQVSAKEVETVIMQVDREPAAENKDVFTLLISGIDTRGAMTAKSLSDVNIIATVNTKTKQVLLVSTPRDYFVPLSISGGVPDKLTHAGIYGVEVCMDTLGMLYDLDINYYFRLNFGGFIRIIDALGGVTVNSDYEFDSKNVAGFHFYKGENYMNGEQALAFARERFSFSEGDRQRGRNQMAVIRAVIDKALSPDLLRNYAALLSGVEGSFETSVPYDMIATLVRQQLNSGGDWNIVSYSVDGTGDSQKPYSMSQKAYVMVPDYSTVEKAKEMMKQVREGQTISQE